MLSNIQRYVRRLAGQRVRRCHADRVPSFEQLESRVLMAVTAVLDAGTLTITGEDDRDVITISADADNPGAGNITVRVAEGLDDDPSTKEQDFTGVTVIVINAGGGNDKITVRPGVNLTGGEASIQINSGEGNDMVKIGQGLTSAGATIGVTVTDTGGRNRIFTAEGNDSITTGAGKDIIRSGAGNDTISSGGGNDNIRSGDGDDVIDGGDGKDNIRGQGGNDSIEGGAGNDNIRGGPGNDTLSGGPGKDNFGRTDPDDTVIDDEAQIVREREPNNARTEAEANPTPTLTTTGADLELIGSVRANDGDDTTNEDNIDLFRVDITEAGLLTITLEGLNGRHVKVEILNNAFAPVLDAPLEVTPEDQHAQANVSIGGANPTGFYFVRVTTTATGRHPSKYRVTLDLDEEVPIV